MFLISPSFFNLTSFFLAFLASLYYLVPYISQFFFLIYLSTHTYLRLRAHIRVRARARVCVCACVSLFYQSVHCQFLLMYFPHYSLLSCNHFPSDWTRWDWNALTMTEVTWWYFRWKKSTDTCPVSRREDNSGFSRG